MAKATSGGTPQRRTTPDRTLPEQRPRVADKAESTHSLIMGEPADFAHEQRRLAVDAPEIAESYEVVGDFNVESGQARLLLVREKADAANMAVAKLYNSKARSDWADPRDTLRELSPEYVIQYVGPGFGTHEGSWWELLEYLPEGDLASASVMQGEPAPAAWIREFVTHMVGCLSHIHNQEPAIIHLDLKPSNLLMRSLDPPRFVLADFGSATVIREKRGAMVSARPVSAAWTAPEASSQARAQVNAARDWWSVGMMVVKLATGLHPFEQSHGDFESDDHMRLRLATRPVPLDEIEDNDIRTLALGLLTRDPDLRWGASEVEAWLAGKAPQPHVESAPSTGTIPTARRRFTFAGQQFDDPAALAAAIASNWEEAATKLIARDLGELASWVEDFYPERSLASIVTARAAGTGIDRTIADVVVRLDPEAAPVFMGRPLHGKGISSLVRAVADGKDAKAAEDVEKLFSSRALQAYSGLTDHGKLGIVENTWQDYCSQAEGWFRRVDGSGSMTPELRALLLHAAASDVAKATKL